MELEEVEIVFSGKGDASQDELDEISAGIQSLILTPAGTCPMAHDYGIDCSFLSMPIPAARNTLAVEIINKVAKYEPRVSVCSVSFESLDADEAMSGKCKIKVVCAIA